MAGVMTRLYRITEPNAVIWDETHFGKMLSWYINGTYFFDVHPPGGKVGNFDLLLALFGWAGGYNGSHPFTAPGLSFEGYSGVMVIRVGCALLGAALVPVAFGCVWTMTRRLPSAVLAGVLVVAEIGTLLLTKYILLDAPLMFFMMAAFFSLCRLQHATLRQGAFSGPWWTSLGATGLFLGCVSVPMYPQLSLGAHVIARVLCLIVVPAAVYLGCFAAHDILLYKTFSAHGSEEAALSPEYQMTLQGNVLHNGSYSPQVVYGGLITLRNDRLAGPYLHSHNLTYPEKHAPGKKQQVTGYRAKDHNNLFRILYPIDDPDSPAQVYSDGPESVRDGDYVRLFHPLTNTSLAVAPLSAFVVRKHKLTLQQPPAENYNPLLGNTPDDMSHEPPSSHNWKIVVAEEDKILHKILLQHPHGTTENNPALEPLRTRFSLINLEFGCALTWSLEKLGAKWAEGQEEITCSKNLKAPEALWRIEANHNPYNNHS
ncbi:hypothetical protein HAZT_HAZT003616 [Hyalella azteca]|uniref:Protein O-mannosyl-transferase 2 n=1 Tax=Hyalella azteca TaxID=294128 RepID=A0A6A0GTW5_HYAAZ|nr:hypothetical protein HAZT_HAZT003616 [Hyalella azteca]